MIQIEINITIFILLTFTHKSLAQNTDANFRPISPTSADPEICQILSAPDVPFDEATNLIRIETDLTLDHESEKEIGTSSPRLLHVSSNQ